MKHDIRRLDPANTTLVMVDVQSKLASLMDGSESLISNISILLKAAKELGMPVLVNEQVPEKLGPTVSELAELLQTLYPDQKPYTKSSFSACGNHDFLAALADTGRRQVLLFGIEAHVCVCQTGLDLLQRDYEVFVVADAVSSRVRSNRDTAVHRMRVNGAKVTTTEMALFELMGTAEHPSFRAISRLLK